MVAVSRVGLLVKSEGIVNLLAGYRARTRPVTARVLVSGCELIFYLSMEVAQRAENLRMLKKFLRHSRQRNPAIAVTVESASLLITIWGSRSSG